MMNFAAAVEAESIRPPTLRAVVADRLQEAIAAGEFREGSFLPPEPELCRRYGVSRTVVREALGTLEARGVVAVQHGRGAIVAHDRSPAVSSLLRFEWRAGRGSLGQLLEARRVLETAVARLAAARATGADVAAMEQALRAMAAAQTPEAYITADLAFHGAIVRAAANPILGLLNDALADLLRASRQQTYFIPGAVESSLRDHRLVYERIAAHLVEGAERAMAAVLDQVERHITEAGLAPDLSRPHRGASPTGATKSGRSGGAARAAPKSQRATRRRRPNDVSP